MHAKDLPCIIKARHTEQFSVSYEISVRSPDQLAVRGSARRSQRTIVRTGLLEEPVLTGGSGGPWRLRPGELLSPSAEKGAEGLDHDVRGACAAASASVGRAVAGFALCVRHGRSPRGKSEDLTILFPSVSPQGLTVSNSTHNAGSHRAHYGSWLATLVPQTRHPRTWKLAGDDGRCASDSASLIVS